MKPVHKKSLPIHQYHLKNLQLCVCCLRHPCKNLNPLETQGKFHLPSWLFKTNNLKKGFCIFPQVAKKDGSPVLSQFPEGFLGKLQIRKSGKVELRLGDIVMDVSEGAAFSFLQVIQAFVLRSFFVCLFFFLKKTSFQLLLITIAMKLEHCKP